jgi:hypothetical protein
MNHNLLIAITWTVACSCSTVMYRVGPPNTHCAMDYEEFDFCPRSIWIMVSGGALPRGRPEG